MQVSNNTQVAHCRPAEPSPEAKAPKHEHHVDKKDVAVVISDAMKNCNQGEKVGHHGHHVHHAKQEEKVGHHGHHHHHHHHVRHETQATKCHESTPVVQPGSKQETTEIKDLESEVSALTGTADSSLQPSLNAANAVLKKMEEDPTYMPTKAEFDAVLAYQAAKA